MDFQELKNGERSREYVFPNGTVKVDRVKWICVRSSGTHRLITEDGGKYIVAPGWLAIKVEADEWSV